MKAKIGMNLRDQVSAGGTISGLKFIENDTKVLVLDDTESSTAKIKSIDINTGEEEVIFHHPKYDPSPVIVDDELIAVRCST